MSEMKTYTEFEIAIAIMNEWIQSMETFYPQYSPDDTLSKVKNLCFVYNMNNDMVKKVFEQVESGYCWNMEEDKVYCLDDICEDCNKEELYCECD